MRCEGTADLSLVRLACCPVDLLIGLVLAERVHRPDGRGEPADQRDLQDETDDSGERTADRKERQPGEEEGDEESHRCFQGVRSSGANAFHNNTHSGGVQFPRVPGGRVASCATTLLRVMEPRRYLPLRSGRPTRQHRRLLLRPRWVAGSPAVAGAATWLPGRPG